MDIVTSFTAKLLNSDVCILSIVDHRHVRWASVCDNLGILPKNMKDEARMDSFCHFVIRNERKGGFVVLDAEKEQKFKEKPLVI